VLGAFNPMSAQFCDHRRRQGYGPSLAALGRFVTDTGARLLCALDDGHLTAIQVHVSPPQRSNLTTPQRRVLAREKRVRGELIEKLEAAT
jgi:hypothetical protein